MVRANGQTVDAHMVTPRDLDAKDRERMYGLMCWHFEGVDREAFEQDVAEKDWILRMDDPVGSIQGFTTLKLLRQDYENHHAYGFFSGDTVLAPEFMSQSSWLRVWSRHIFRVASELDGPAYWVLLTATHRTYRIISTAFSRFHPDPRVPASSKMQRLLGDFVRQKFPEEYDEDKGVVKLKVPVAYRYQEEVEAACAEGNSHNRFFRTANPGYLRGDFLCCLTEIRRDNITALGRRILLGPRARPKAGGRASLELRLDMTRCQGHGRCFDLAPDLVDVDDDGLPRLRGSARVPANLQDKAQLIASNCPEGAVRLELVRDE
ncbi:MAG: ferredoxin [Myxococcales bacterium]|nr:ferredoxin [Myxococcales bacterium]MDD9966246.1 ferredoxin [Myxococcales bacterium]